MDVHFLDATIKGFVNILEEDVRARVYRMLVLLQEKGYMLRMPFSKKVNSILFELRVRGTTHVRLLYVFSRQHIWVVHGFIKKTQQIPQKEIDTAMRKIRRLDQL